MRYLILGGDGMLGHQLYKRLRLSHETCVTLHGPEDAYRDLKLFDPAYSCYGIDARDAESISRVLGDLRPDVAINAVGIVKQRDEAEQPIPSIEVNALLPHRLAAACAKVNARLIHLSTDCVFSGRAGYYGESSMPDPVDLYGRSKLLGEVTGKGFTTLRTSMIGPELRRKTGLLEWFLRQHGAIKGYTRAVFSGFTTLELARIVERLSIEPARQHSLYHVSSAPISKYELLVLIKRRLGLEIDIVPDDAFVCDRSLDSSRFRTEFGYTPPSWETMIDELATYLREAYI